MKILLVILLVAVVYKRVRGSHYYGSTAIPHVLHNNYLADTHEVAAAKSAHLAALATQSHGHGYGGSQGYSGDDEHSISHGKLRYHGPTAIPHVLHDGHIADTHEVAAAKSAHLAAVATQSHGHGYGGSQGYSGDDEHSSSHGDLRYHGPTAIPHVLYDGQVADTREVAAAKAEHYATVAKVHGGYVQDDSRRYGEENHGHLHRVAPYHGPLANPVVLKSGYLADTRKVAAAKAEHFATVAKAMAHAGYGHDYRYTARNCEHFGEYNGYLHHGTPFHVPLAKPVALKSGDLPDTHDVAVSKQHIIHLLHLN